MTSPVKITDGRHWLMVHPDLYRNHKDDLAATGWHKQERSNPMHPDRDLPEHARPAKITGLLPSEEQMLARILDRDLPQPYGSAALEPPDEPDDLEPYYPTDPGGHPEDQADAQAMQREGN